MNEVSQEYDLGKAKLVQPSKINQWDFPGGTVDINPPAKAGDMSPTPGPGRLHIPQSN